MNALRICVASFVSIHPALLPVSAFLAILWMNQMATPVMVSLTPKPSVLVLLLENSGTSFEEFSIQGDLKLLCLCYPELLLNYHYSLPLLPVYVHYLICMFIAGFWCSRCG